MLDGGTYRTHCKPCKACGKVDELGRCVGLFGYHIECFPCKACGKGEVDGHYVLYDGYHKQCNPQNN